MKQLVCEMCGGTDLIKQDGVFVCQTCGCKYSVEEAKKMMVEGVVEVTGTVKVDNSDSLNTYLEMARTAAKAGNYEEADKYASKVVEINPEHGEAWIIKGTAVGWQSKLGNQRIVESLEFWSKGLALVSAEERDKFKEEVKDEFTSLIKALFSLRCDNFKNYPDQNDVKSIVTGIFEMRQYQQSMILKTSIVPDIEDVSEFMAIRMNAACVAASDAADRRFGPEKSDKSQYAWRNWMQTQDFCLQVLESAMELANTLETANQIYRKYDQINSSVIGSCSYKFEASAYGLSGYYPEYSLQESAKTIRRGNTAAMKKKIDEVKDKIKKKEEEKKQKQKETNEKFWKKHEAQKEQLDNKLKELETLAKPYNDAVENVKQQIQQVDKEINGPTESQDILDDLLEKVKDLESQRDKCGIFQGKEKARLQDSIEKYNARVAEVKKDIEGEQARRKERLDANKRDANAYLAKVNAEKRVYDDQIRRIKNVLEKDRNESEVDNDGDFMVEFAEALEAPKDDGNSTDVVMVTLDRIGEFKNAIEIRDFLDQRKNYGDYVPDDFYKKITDWAAIEKMYGNKYQQAKEYIETYCGG